MMISGIVLCGGRGSRLGGADKGLRKWGKTTLVASVIHDLDCQVSEILISANRNLERYRQLGHPVFPDEWADYRGPLAGIAATLPHCRSEIAVVVPCDCPGLPPDLVKRLLEPLRDKSIDLSYADDGRQRQYLFSAIRTSCLTGLQEQLAQGQRSVKAWHEGLRVAAVDFSDQAGVFINLNKEKDFET
jgi:molybdopterin-guanine dinucleotide biosynthesis protein A